MTVRVIPRLDIKGPHLVKGIRLEGLRVLGDPAFFARHYDAEGADELLYVDVVASLYERNSLLDIVARTARELFIPLTVAGGIRSLSDVRDALRAGADKVAINTAAIRRPELITEAARRFGSSTIVVSIEAKRVRPDAWEPYVDGGRERSGRDALAWAVEAAERGAGEILVTSVDRDGTGQGLDAQLVRRIAAAVEVPVIASGGTASADDAVGALTSGAADAVAIGSLLHYGVVDAVARGRLRAGEAEVTRRHQRPWDAPAGLLLGELKHTLRARGLACRDAAVAVIA